MSSLGKRAGRSIALAAVVLVLCVLPCLSAAAYDPHKAWYSQYYNIAAFCKAENIQRWDCGPACQANPNFVPYKVLDNDDWDTQALTGVDHERKEIVLAFRGSLTYIWNIFEDVQFWFRDYVDNLCPGKCEVETGFYKSYLSLRQAVRDTILTLYVQNTNYTVLVTGHSLGAAMATLAAVDLTMMLSETLALAPQTVPLQLYTHGSPRVGNKAFVRWAMSILPPGQSFRIVHARDIIPQMPLRFGGYIHMPNEVWYTTFDNTTYTLCQDSIEAESSACSDSLYFWQYRKSDHMDYFGVDVLCDAKPVTSDLEERVLMFQRMMLEKGQLLQLSAIKKD